MADQPTVEQARAHLTRAAALDRDARRNSRWYGRYLATFAVAFAGLTLLLGLVPSLAVRVTLFATLWPVFVLGMVLWALRQRTASRNVGRRTVPYWVGSGGSYGIALIVGTPSRIGDVAYWVPAALLVAAPLAVGAWRESQR